MNKRINKSAFTLIELLVVTTIIVIISSSWIFYFLDFVKDQETWWKLVIIDDNFNTLDKKIKDYTIFDYELILNTTTLTWWYITYINNFDIPFNQTISFNSSTWSWIISTSWSSSDNWNIKLYKKQKLFLNENRQADLRYEFSFNKEPYYKIWWTLSWEVLNEININYFSEDNLYPEKNNWLELININTKENKSWTNYSSLIIKNIWWTKSILWNWTTSENEIYLFFENSWKEKFIKIKK